MAYPSSYSPISSTVGIDLNNASTTQLFALGTKCFGSNNSEWIYVQAATSVTAYKAVSINSTFTCGMASGADFLLAQQETAWAQTSIPASSFAWVVRRGDSVGVMCTGSVSANNQLFLAASGTPTGMCSISASASGTLYGVTLVSVVDTALATVHTAVLTWPRGVAPQ